jgi:hypothetical protein
MCLQNYFTAKLSNIDKDKHRRATSIQNTFDNCSFAVEHVDAERHRHAKCASCLGASRQAVACGLNGGLRGQCSGTIPQRLDLEYEVHHTASKLYILGFEPLK